MRARLTCDSQPVLSIGLPPVGEAQSGSLPLSWITATCRSFDCLDRLGRAPHVGVSETAARTQTVVSSVSISSFEKPGAKRMPRVLERLPKPSAPISEIRNPLSYLELFRALRRRAAPRPAPAKRKLRLRQNENRNRTHADHVPDVLDWDTDG